MKHYIDISLLPSDDIGIHFLWSKVIRHDQTQEQATLFYSGYVMDKEVKALPFIKMKSLGSGDEFNLSIRRKSAVLDNAESSFSTYGFNRQAALPKF